MLVPAPPASSAHRSSASSTSSSAAQASADAEQYWHVRSVYAAPTAPSASHCILQNDLLCTFGGLLQECGPLLFRIISKEEALLPSTRVLYTQACQQARIPPHPPILEQLSVTPGKYQLVVLDAAGIPLGVEGITSLFTILRANRHVLTTINLRSCSLRNGGLKTLVDRLLSEQGRLMRLESLELSCNMLVDEDAAELVRLIEGYPTLTRIGILKNSISRSITTRISAMVNSNRRAQTPESNRSSRCSPLRRARRSPPRRDFDLDDYGSPSSSRKSPSPIHGRKHSPTTMDAKEDKSVYSSLHIPKMPAEGEAVRLPRISKADFNRTIAMYRQLMTKQTALLDLHIFQANQPSIFEVFRRQTSATPNIDTVTLPRYLCACFPHLHPSHVMYALAFYSEYSLTAPIRNPSRTATGGTASGLRADQREEIMSIFKVLDKENKGVIPWTLLCPPRASDAEISETRVMLDRLHIDELNFDSFAQLMAPYLIEARKKKRFR